MGNPFFFYLYAYTHTDITAKEESQELEVSGIQARTPSIKGDRSEEKEAHDLKTD
jgi:hypothetical protein